MRCRLAGCGTPKSAMPFDYAKFYSRSHDAVIRVYDASRQRDRDGRARGRFQRPVVAPCKFSTCSRRLLPGKTACDRPTENTTVAKILHCGKNKITESV